VLISPNFLFRVEHDPRQARAGQTRAIDGYELATRLSFLIWSSIPDDRLLGLARSGQLVNSSTLEREVRRMLADHKAEALVENFGMQFLGLEELRAFVPDKGAYPTFNTTLRADMAEESKRMLAKVFLENRSVLELVSANYSFLNERLAKHYGVQGVNGPQFREVTFGPSDARGGVLGLGAVLMVTSHTTITSPVFRGKWVLSNLFNQPPSPPPPGIPPLQATNTSGRQLTGREQMEQHRTSPVCASCHARMDPFGFALENYDVMGAWRTKDEGGNVDPSVKLPNGTAFSGPVGLKQALLARPDDLARAVTERLMIFALGRRLTAHDAPVVRRIVADTKVGGYRFHDIVLAIAKSTQFRKRTQGETNVL
jgi:hypothetical protein